MSTLLRRLLVVLAALVVGGTFLAAGVLKGLDVEGFARDIALHKITGPWVSAVAARLLIPFEIAVGAAAIVGYRRKLALVLLAVVLVVFIGGTAWAWAHGNTEGCGCFGRFASRTPLAVIVEDVLLLAAAALGTVLDRESTLRGDRRPAPRSLATATATGAGEGRPMEAGARAGESRRAGSDDESAAGASWARRSPSWRGLLVGALALAATGLALASPYLPIDDLATALRPGVDLHSLGLDAIAGGLEEGDRLLVILVLDDPRSQTAVPALNALSALGGASGVPRLTALTSADEQARSAFFFEYAPAFDLLEVPGADLRRLYRRAPRAFRVHNGEVLQVWEGVPPAEDLAK